MMMMMMIIIVIINLVPKTFSLAWGKGPENEVDPTPGKRSWERGCVIITQGECWMLSMARSRRLYSQLLEGWGRNA